LIFVPAFNGLFTPYWRDDARGLIIGLTQKHSDSHICRAALESIALMVNDVLSTIETELGYSLNILKVDGGVTKSDFLMQLQANVSNISVLCPEFMETTSLGAAIGAKKFFEGINLQTINEKIK